MTEFNLICSFLLDLVQELKTFNSIWLDDFGKLCHNVTWRQTANELKHDIRKSNNVFTEWSLSDRRYFEMENKVCFTKNALVYISDYM